MYPERLNGMIYFSRLVVADFAFLPVVGSSSGLSVVVAAGLVVMTVGLELLAGSVSITSLGLDEVDEGVGLGGGVGCLKGGIEYCGLVESAGLSVGLVCLAVERPLFGEIITKGEFMVSAIVQCVRAAK